MKNLKISVKGILIFLFTMFALISTALIGVAQSFEVGFYYSKQDTATIRTKTEEIPSFISLMKDGEIVYGDATWEIIMAPKFGPKLASRIKTYRVYRLLDGSTYLIPKPTPEDRVRQIYCLIKAKNGL